MSRPTNDPANRPVEDRLREAYQARAGQLTEPRLDQLAADREQSLAALLGDPDTIDPPDTIALPPAAEPPAAHRRHRWLAPAIAAAVVAALAAGGLGLAGQRGHTGQAGPAVSHVPAVSTPAPDGTSAPTTAPSASATRTQTQTGPAYLPAGRTGSRDQVPWSLVGSGWRLLLPITPGSHGGGTALYLYDPAGGRYLISDRLPAPSHLLAWSPDGNRALLSTGTYDVYRYRELDLRTGIESTGFSVPRSVFISYTQPRGLAMMIAQDVGGQEQLVRYGENGSVEFRYPVTVPGGGRLGISALYTPDGTGIVGNIENGPVVLLGNDGHLVRRYPTPDGSTSCTPLKWWSTDTVLEMCYLPERPGAVSAVTALYLQPVAGGGPNLLTDNPSPLKMGHNGAWPLTNGDVLLANTSGCGSGGFDVLTSDGTVRPLRLPAGITAPGRIVNMAGDLATFLEDGPGCGIPATSRMIDYDMVTGRTSTLFHGQAVLVSWPGGRS